jgi:hypothetical protein
MSERRLISMASQSDRQYDCRTMMAQLPELLPDLVLDPAAVPFAATRHLEDCSGCRAAVDRELGAHVETMQLLDQWKAPEVSPYFHSRMTALLREEQARPRTGWASWRERAQSWFLLSNLHVKPAAGVAALGLLLAIGGGAYLDLNQNQMGQNQMGQVAPAPQASATVRDLQSLDENAQVFQQMNSLDAGDDGAPGGNL